MIATLNSADLRLLQVFKAVVECGGFSAAQIELNVSQSTISTQMADLETRLGARLCQRGRAGFNLTEDGRLVYEASQRLFRSLDAFAAEVGEMRGRLVGDLHLATIDNVISNRDCPLHEAVTLFKRRAGAVRLTLHVGPPLEIERAVLDGRYHVGIGTFPSHAPGLAYRALFRERMSLYCGRDHPLFGRDDADLTLTEIGAAEYARRGYATASRIAALTPRNVSATAFNMEAIAVMVLSGRFIGHLPDHYAARWVGQGSMRALKPERLSFDSPFEIVVRKGPPRTAAADIFLEVMTDVCRTAGGVAAAEA